MPVSETADYQYDLVVIGAGSGGVRAARRAAERGRRVAVVEADRVGGTCVLRGCVPKKLFVNSSRYADAFEDSVGFGWHVDNLTFDWPTLTANVEADVSWLSSVYIRNLEKAGVEIVHGRASLKDAHTVAIEGDPRELTSAYILIATGGHPRRHIGGAVPVPGIEHAITSDEFFHLPRLPKRVLLVGGSYIAAEIAAIFAGFAVDVTILYRGKEIFRGLDMEMRHLLHAGLEQRGVTVITGDEVALIAKREKSLAVTTKAGRELDVEEVLLAVGRDPNTRNLGLEAVGVKLDATGAVAVDAYSQSSVANIYAVGDVTNRLQFTPVAIREGSAFVETVFGGNPVAVDYENVAAAVFSTPEVGFVGLTEEEARAQYDALDIYRSTFKPLPNRVAGRDERMTIKLIVDGDTDRVLGCHILGTHAAELVQLVAIAIRLRATKADFDATMALHPTLAEEIVTMGEPAERVRRAAAE
jgi:glutathione reductase (NADPH)